MTRSNTATMLATGLIIMSSAIITAQDATMAQPPAADPAAATATPMPLPGDPTAAPLPLPGDPTAAPLPLPGTTPAPLPGMPGAPQGIQPGLPTLPGVAATPAMGTMPTPPPLPGLASAAVAPGDSAAALASTAAPSNLYTFLFIDDPEYGIVRQKFEAEVAERLKEGEILRLMEERRGSTGVQSNSPYNAALGMGASMDPALMGGATMPAEMMGAAGMGIDAGFGAADIGMPGMGMGGTGQGIAMTEEAIRAAAEWDFYYSQLEMYDRYVREKLIPDAEELPELAYTAENALQERQDLLESFQEAAITQAGEEYNDNRDFYDRLQQREDRRLAYEQWLLLKQKQVAEWAEKWSRNINGSRWADGEEVRIDDWYYGTDFNSATPVTVSIDNRQYIVSRQPVEGLKEGQLNVISSNLTPYDIIDSNGYLKNPVMETLRGTIVVPPVAPVTDTGVGTIDIVDIPML